MGLQGEWEESQMRKSSLKTQAETEG